MAAVAVAILLPRVMVQEWSVRVIDEVGIPLPDVRLERAWDDYTFSASAGDELRTNQAGAAVFPRKA